MKHLKNYRRRHLFDIKMINAEITYIPDQFFTDEEREEFLKTLRS
jgi:hypothetical protein